LQKDSDDAQRQSAINPKSPPTGTGDGAAMPKAIAPQSAEKQGIFGFFRGKIEACF
jgi:hypothetical protein